MSELSIEDAEIFKVRFWSPEGKSLREKYIGTNGYYPGGGPVVLRGTRIYETVFSECRTLIAKLCTTPARQFNGYSVLIDFCQFIRISYATRTSQKRTRSFKVDSFGSEELSEQEGKFAFEAKDASRETAPTA
jgi:hypothetical protein